MSNGLRIKSYSGVQWNYHLKYIWYLQWLKRLKIWIPTKPLNLSKYNFSEAEYFEGSQLKIPQGYYDAIKILSQVIQNCTHLSLWKNHVKFYCRSRYVAIFWGQVIWRLWINQYEYIKINQGIYESIGWNYEDRCR